MSEHRIYSSNDALEILSDLKYLIKDKDAWTTEVCARDFENKPVAWYSENATKWCMLGGISVVCHKKNISTYYFDRNIGRLIVEQGKLYNISAFNDGKSHDDVMGIIDQAIVRFDEFDWGTSDVPVETSDVISNV